MDKVIAHELEIIGSHGMQAHRYSDLLEMIKAGKLHPERLISGRISLEEATSALAEMNNFKTCGIQVIHSF